MDAILNNLRDPSWWFTAIFVTIIVGVAAGFLKEKTESVISSLSSRYKYWASSRAEARATVVRLLAGNPQFLLLTYISVVVGLLIHVVAVILYLVTLLFFDAAPHEAVAGDARGFMIWKVLMPFLGAVATYVGFRATARLSLVNRALKLYRENNNFPNVP
jgi:spore maturation protein SpmA